MNFISKDKINTSRQKEVDYFRGFAAIILIICHTALYLGDNGDQALFVFGDIIGSEFGAPVFMSMMGISIVYSKHNDPRDLLKRGISLFLLGYLLNVVRSLIPFLIIPNKNYFSTFESLFVVDILQFAGLSFMLISLLKKIKVKSWGIVLISLLFAFIDQIFFGLETQGIENKPLAYLLNLFIPIDDYSCFPFLTWFFFPAFGYLLGDILVRTTNKNKLYTIYFIVGLLAVIYVYGSFIYLFPDYYLYYAGNNFYYMGVVNLIVNGLLICFGLSFWYFVSKITPKFIDKYLSFLSKNLNVFYLISWIIISSILLIISFFDITLKTYIVIILMVLIQIVTSLLTKLYVNIKK